MAKVVGVGLLLLSLTAGFWVCGRPAGDDLPPAARVAGVESAPVGGGVAGGWPAVVRVAADSGATVFIDGDSVGTAPAWVADVPPGERRLRVVTPAGVVADTLVVVVSRELAEFDFLGAAPTDGGVRGRTLGGTLDPPTVAEAPARPPAEATGGLRVSSSPSGATVLVDGRRAGVTPVAVGGVRPGRYAVTVALPGYATVVREVRVEPGGFVDAVVALEAEAAVAAATGTVEVLVRPWGRIEIDGVVHREETDVVYRTPLPPGPHRVRVTHPELGSVERTVVVERGKRARVEVDLADGSR